MHVVTRDGRKRFFTNTVLGKVVVGVFLFSLREFLTFCSELQTCYSLGKIWPKKLRIFSWKDRQKAIITHEQLSLILGRTIQRFLITPQIYQGCKMGEHYQIDFSMDANGVTPIPAPTHITVSW